MALKNIIKPYKLVDAVSMGADVTSASVDVKYSDNIGVQLVFTGTPTGNFYVQGTIDGDTWTALDFGTIPTATGADGDHLLNMNNLPYQKIRIFYDRTSGSGSLTVWVMAKTLGG
jgi:hypothetical protein